MIQKLDKMCRSFYTRSDSTNNIDGWVPEESRKTPPCFYRKKEHEGQRFAALVFHDLFVLKLGCSVLLPNRSLRQDLHKADLIAYLDAFQ